jgi:hypothetical protein
MEPESEAVRISYATLILVAAVVLIGIGIQTLLFQRASTAHDECVSEWGDRLIATSSTRTEAQQKYEDAATRRDDSLDSLLVAAIGIQDLPDRTRRTALADLITDYVKSVEAKRKAAARLSVAREKHPLPQLRC